MADITELIAHSKEFRDRLLADRYRPGYHFAFPGDIGIPGDSNGCFYAGGRYHMMFLYQCRSDSFRWGHVSSTDMLHWRLHSDALIPDEDVMPGGNAADSGIFSGGAFVCDDGRVFLTYWALPKSGAGGLRIAVSDDAENNYEKWEKQKDYAVSSTEFGLTVSPDGELIGCADPSNIWKMNGKYYFQAGNLLVLNKYRDDTEAAHFHGDWTDLYRSDDLISWEYRGRFYSRDGVPADGGYMPPEDSEDDMCPSLLPLFTREGEKTDKYLQLFISHNKGCRYYIGTLDAENERFIPELHGRMTWDDNTYFAPEALITPDNRQIAWTWFNEDFDGEHELANGWSGIYALPRELWYDEKRHCLGISPARELKTLRYLQKDGVWNGSSYETELVFSHKKAHMAGLSVRIGENGEHTDIYYDAENGMLVFDTENSGCRGRKIIERAPLRLDDGEELRLDIFVDKSVIEVFANDRQCIARKIYPSGKNRGTAVLGCPDLVTSWKMMETNLY